MVTKFAATTPFRKNAKVKATTDLKGVPEGTRGKVKLVNGTDWVRYWVMFDNDVWLGSIDHASLVLAKEWESFLRNRAANPDDSSAPAAAASDSGAEAADAGGDVGGVPAHLLERSRARRAALAAGDG